MSWIVITLLGAVVLGLVGVLDKAFIHHYARSLRTLPMLIGLSHIPIAAVFIAVSPLDDLTIGAAAWGLGAGVFGGLSAVVFFRVMARREVSRTIPVVQTFPIFVAPAAVLFLGESLRLLDWAAIFLTVLGAVLISVRQDAGGRGFAIDRSFYQLLGASILMAGMNIAAKQALGTLPVLLVHAFRSLGVSIPLLAFTARVEPMVELRGMIRDRSPALAIFGVNEFLVVNTGMVLNLWATSLGPVSLVTALSASSSLFLLLYSTLLGPAVSRDAGRAGQSTSGRRQDGRDYTHRRRDRDHLPTLTILGGPKKYALINLTQDMMSA